VFEPFAAAARAEVATAKLLDEQLIAVHHADADLHLRFGGETSSTFAHRLERSGFR
jgi:hypothetical protein